jgi:hypothetical protein
MHYVAKRRMFRAYRKLLQWFVGFFEGAMKLIFSQVTDTNSV